MSDRDSLVVMALDDHPLKRWRERHGLTQAQLAERCGVRQNAISRYERGERVPRGDDLLRLLKTTELPAEALVLPEHFLRQHPDFLRTPPPKPPHGRRGRT
jgi:transcriptional regulator with XRE-family HTH domain